MNDALRDFYARSLTAANGYGWVLARDADQRRRLCRTPRLPRRHQEPKQGQRRLCWRKRLW